MEFIRCGFLSSSSTVPASAQREPARRLGIDHTRQCTQGCHIFFGVGHHVAFFQRPSFDMVKNIRLVEPARPLNLAPVGLNNEYTVRHDGSVNAICSPMSSAPVLLYRSEHRMGRISTNESHLPITES